MTTHNKIHKADHSQMDHSQMDHGQMDHGQMDHSAHGQMDHSQMDHSAHEGHEAMDHSQMDHSAHGQMDHGQMDHGTHGGHGGHDGHAGHSEGMFKRPFWISLILTIPVLYYAHLFQELLGYQAPAFPGSQYLGLVLGSIIYWYGGWVFLTGAISEIRSRAPGMMTLVALAISTAYAYSVAITFGIVEGMDFYWELATLVTIMLLGHWMEMRAIGSAQSALNELAKLLPDQAERIVNGRTETVAVSALQGGDLVLVRPGASIPADGLVQEGDSQLNESMITGESRPVHKRPGDEVIAGTVNGSGSLRVTITKTGEQTALAGIMRLVAEAQNSRSRAQDLANRAAYWLTFVALGVALLTLVGWLFARGFDAYTLERVVTVLVVACPHALGLAIPLVIAISTTLSARNGILVRDRLALEQARNLNMVVFDKTGTLTKGELGLVDMAIGDWETGEIENVRGATQQQRRSADLSTSELQSRALAIAAAIEGDSEHPLARAIVTEAEERGLELPAVREFTALPGRGVQATVAGRQYQVGGPRLLEQTGATLPPALAQATKEWGARGQTVVYLVTDSSVQIADNAEQHGNESAISNLQSPMEVVAAFALADVIRPESREAVARLAEQGIGVAMLTGDSEDVARWVAGELGIATYFAQVLPEHKAAKVKELQAGGAKVAMVGDGVNDAPALAQADVGIAIGAGTDVARAAAGIVLVRNDPRDIGAIVALSRASYRKMVQNLSWAVGYNAIALPLAAGVLAGVGLVLPAWVGAVLMSLSTIIVAINAQTLRGLRLRGEG